MRPKPAGCLPFSEATWAKIRADPEFFKAFLAAYLAESIPVQATLLRTLAGIPQVELARKLGIKQTHFSRLEKDGSDHVTSVYKRLGAVLHAKLALIPDDVEIVLRK